MYKTDIGEMLYQVTKRLKLNAFFGLAEPSVFELIEYYKEFWNIEFNY